MARTQSLFGIYPNRESIEEAVSALRSNGFPATDIAVLCAETPTRDLAHKKGTKSLEGIGVGAVLGAAVLGALGWLVATGALGPFQFPYYMEWLDGAEPLLAALAGVGAGGLLGGIVGGIIGLGIPVYEARRYKGRLRKKGILLSVHCEDANWRKRARAILLRTGGEKVAAKMEISGDYAVVAPKRSRRSDLPATHSDSLWPFVHQRNAASLHEPHSVLLATDSRDLDDLAIATDAQYDRPSGTTSRMPARDLMSTNVDVVEESTTLSEAAEKMRTAGTGFLLVRSEGAIVGVVTDRDIAVRAGAQGHNPKTTSVRSVMTTHYTYCREDQDLTEVAKIMEETHFRRLPVLDRAMRLVGVISLKDLATKAKSARLEGQVLRLVAAGKD